MLPFIVITVTAGLVFILGKLLGWQAARPATAKAPAPAPPQPLANPMRELLFGDLPLAAWTGGGSDAAPWSFFHQARQHIATGQKAEAEAALRQVLAMPNLESRHYVQAWTALRELGVSPAPEQSKQVLGVVVEVGMQQGLDVLAAYPDHSARFFHCSGRAVIWEHPNTSLDEVMERLLQSAASIVKEIGPWDRARPGPPAAGQMRLSFLTPSGLHFGQGAIEELSNDPLARETINQATKLMMGLMEKSEAPKAAQS